MNLNFFFFIYETKSGFVVYAFPFSTQVVLLHLEIMAPKKRKRQSTREHGANAMAAASAGKTSSQLATWMERVFLLCESACAESDASLSCSWQFKFLWFVVCEILMRLFLMFLSVEIPMKKNSSASWSLGGISARKWPSMR